ncbi:protein YaiW [Enterobacter cloacae]|uniref:Protein YaiW n=1 Tax=Enterobacter cloacae TaxID=550 RepID=A0A377M5Q0_ENTCL|nr:protein YaiW [Enterobacter cloacae]
MASVVRQKMPSTVKDRNAWAEALAKTFESQKIAPTEENICSVLAVAQQESMYQSDPVVPGLNKIAWKEIDRRAESMHIPVFLVHTALKITSPNGKSYSDRLDTVKTEKQLSAIFDDFINMVPMGRNCSARLTRCTPAARCRSALRLPSSIRTVIRGKSTGRCARKSSPCVADCGLARTIC